jgi:hypothetical protein
MSSLGGVALELLKGCAVADTFQVFEGGNKLVEGAAIAMGTC